MLGQLELKDILKSILLESTSLIQNQDVVETLNPQMKANGFKVETQKLYEIQKSFRDKNNAEKFRGDPNLQQYIENHKLMSSIEVKRFPSISSSKKLANQHALPLTNMLTCESVFNFQRQAEEESVIKKNRLMLENTIVSSKMS